jgi:alpha-D-xyloside xylohydrolase
MLLVIALLQSQSTIRVRAWGPQAIRVQICADVCDDSLPGALGEAPPPQPIGSEQLSSIGDDGTYSGNLRCIAAAAEDAGAVPSVICHRISDNLLLLRATRITVPSAATGGSATFTFKGSATSVFGMGQNRPGAAPMGSPGGPFDTRSMDARNQSFDFRRAMSNEGGATNAAPFIIGGRSAPAAAAAGSTGGDFTFGLLFNSPSYGGMDIGESNVTCYTAPDQSGGVAPIRKQLDFLILTTAAVQSGARSGAFSIHEAYTAAVGRVPMMPASFQLYWHCKNRYATQTELLDAARYLHAHAPYQVGVLVIDWFHWSIMGDWSFDPTYWPDPLAMVEECARYGIEIMASVWPFTCKNSRSFDMMTTSGWVASNGTGAPFDAYGACRLVDPSNTAAQQYVWSLLNTSYAQYGIRSFWLDCSEPWNPPSGSAFFGDPRVPGASKWSWADAGAMYDVAWPKLFRDGLEHALGIGDGQQKKVKGLDGVLLPRAGWIGTWKHGASLWNGDIGSTLPILATSLKTILSAQLTGFGWMTIDGGGYAGGDSQSPAYRETQLRWMQLTLTLPIMRQHGQRDHTIFNWYGDANEQALVSLVHLRFNLSTYIGAELAKLAKTGRPFNRPLMWDFPADVTTWALAERGLGTQNGAHGAPSGGTAAIVAAALKPGDVVVAEPCGVAPRVSLDTPSGGECSYMYRYIFRESCSQFDSLPLTSLTIPLDQVRCSFGLPHPRPRLRPQPPHCAWTRTLQQISAPRTGSVNRRCGSARQASRRTRGRAASAPMIRSTQRYATSATLGSLAPMAARRAAGCTACASTRRAAGTRRPAAAAAAACFLLLLLLHRQPGAL